MVINCVHFQKKNLFSRNSISGYLSVLPLVFAHLSNGVKTRISTPAHPLVRDNIVTLRNFIFSITPPKAKLDLGPNVFFDSSSRARKQTSFQCTLTLSQCTPDSVLSPDDSVFTIVLSSCSLFCSSSPYCSSSDDTSNLFSSISYPFLPPSPPFLNQPTNQPTNQ